MKDVIWEGRGTNHVGLLVTSQTVFTEGLIQAAVRGETIDSLLQRKMIAFLRGSEFDILLSAIGSAEVDKNNR